MWEFIEPHLPIGEYGPYYPKTLRQQFEGMIWRFRTGVQRREMSSEFGAWSTVSNRSRQWRDAEEFQALLEDLIAEAAKRREVDLYRVGIDSTTTRAHHDAAGMHLGKEVLTALEKTAAEEEKARQRGQARRAKQTRGRSGPRAGGTTTGPPPAEAPPEHCRLQLDRSHTLDGFIAGTGHSSLVGRPDQRRPLLTVPPARLPALVPSWRRGPGPGRAATGPWTRSPQSGGPGRRW
ncbi:transposase [Streptomyces sp. R33]|uniref:Transposase n=1 Tax=Streptomyces sp. R33 TaxID=3238629 RepID=A0AB39YHD9_9ACTN